jgi:UDP-N-acetylmuramate: L-alanyl-gamma-D-glutamyl-meso-diaminopimelate ligase
MRPTEQTRLEIYIVAIGGTGMAPLACLLQEQGHRVRGTDGPLYPPMSTLLERAGIRPTVGYDAAHLEPAPDLVVVGNAVRSDNPEAIAAARLGVPVLSMPQALARFFLAGRRPLVVTGTHGKTTTTAMAAWVYSQCGADPGYLIGGVPHDLPGSFAAGGTQAAPAGEPAGEGLTAGSARDLPAAAQGRFIVEGDEYNAAYFDRGAKFLHYRPETLILTSVEYDHADLYPSPEALREAYRQVIAQLPADGLLVACGDTREVRELARRAPCRTILYGLEEGNEVRPAGCEATRGATRFRVADAGGGEVTIELPLAGGHNVANALAVWAAARRDGLAAGQVAAALAGFHGVKRRLEELGSRGGVTVVDDFAHHPTAVGKTLAALRQSYPGRRLVAVFEPRSLTAGRAMFFDAYREAFAAADRVLFAPTFHSGRLSAEERLDFAAVAAALAADGVAATRFAGVDELLAHAVAESRPGDVLVTMSSGSFEDLPRRLLAALPAPPIVAGEARADAHSETSLEGGSRGLLKASIGSPPASPRSPSHPSGGEGDAPAPSPARVVS